MKFNLCIVTYVQKGGTAINGFKKMKVVLNCDKFVFYFAIKFEEKKFDS